MLSAIFLMISETVPPRGGHVAILETSTTYWETLLKLYTSTRNALRLPESLGTEQPNEEPILIWAMLTSF